MESLSNSNFLKAIDVKKNNDINTNEKNLIVNEKSFIKDEVHNIENKFDEFLSNEGLSEKFSALERQKKQDSKKKSIIENSEGLLADASIKNCENDNIKNLNFIPSQKQTEKNSFLSSGKDMNLNFNLSNKKKKLVIDNTEIVSKQNVIKNDLEKNVILKPQNDLETSKENKFRLDTQSIENISKKSKIKSFFQNYFNYTFKKYSKKNISFKKSHITNFNSNENKNFKEVTTFLSNTGMQIKDNINVIKEHSNNITIETNNREQVHFNESNVKPSNEKNITNMRETSSDNFDRLKNILDITSNDIKQRFSQILENNIKMNNNRFEIQLRPENLGKIHITLEITGHDVDININSDNISAIQSLTENNSNLQKMLQNHGMNLNNFNFNGNNKGLSKEAKKNEDLKNEDVSVKIEESNDDNSFVSSKLVYAEA